MKALVLKPFVGYPCFGESDKGWILPESGSYSYTQKNVHRISGSSVAAP